MWICQLLKDIASFHIICWAHRNLNMPITLFGCLLKLDSLFRNLIIYDLIVLLQLEHFSLLFWFFLFLLLLPFWLRRIFLFFFLVVLTISFLLSGSEFCSFFLSFWAIFKRLNIISWLLRRFYCRLLVCFWFSFLFLLSLLFFLQIIAILCLELFQVILCILELSIQISYAVMAFEVINHVRLPIHAIYVQMTCFAL